MVVTSPTRIVGARRFSETSTYFYPTFDPPYDDLQRTNSAVSTISGNSTVLQVAMERSRIGTFGVAQPIARARMFRKFNTAGPDEQWAASALPDDLKADRRCSVALALDTGEEQFQHEFEDI